MTDSPAGVSAQSPEDIAKTTRYTSYTVFRRLSGLTEDGELTIAQVTAALEEGQERAAGARRQVECVGDVDRDVVDDDVQPGVPGAG